MDIQNILTTAIEVVFTSFVALIIFDFIDGLWVVPVLAVAPPTLHTVPAMVASRTAAGIASSGRNAITTEQPQPEATPTTQQSHATISDPWKEPIFEQLPDPWLTEIQPTPILPQAVVLQFPTLKLLPPAPAKVQPSKRAKSTKKSATKPKSTNTTKQAKTAVTQPRSKSRKLAA